MAITYMTKEGYDKKMKEIAYLESVERPRISAAIAEARDKGDLSENSEYDAAKEAQGMLEMKISQLKDMLASARIIDEAKLNTEEVQIMNTVTIKNTKNGATMTYTIVADSEANLKEKKIASSTPIAKGLLGKHVGDIAEIRVPQGLMTFEIVKIEILYLWQQPQATVLHASLLLTKFPRTKKTSPSSTSIPSTKDTFLGCPKPKTTTFSTLATTTTHR